MPGDWPATEVRGDEEGAGYKVRLSSLFPRASLPRTAPAPQLDNFGKVEGDLTATTLPVVLALFALKVHFFLMMMSVHPRSG